VFAAALQAYEELVEIIFAPFKELLPTALLLPATLHGTVYETDRNIGPVIDYFLEAQPIPGHSSVSIELGEDRSRPNSIERFEQVLVPQTERARRLRPSTADIVGATYHQSILDIYGLQPARDLALSWLASDLRSIGWMR
jgi:hypothetical protein